jgi:hypothetical protein
MFRLFGAGGLALAGLVAGATGLATVQREVVEVVFTDPGPDQSGVALSKPIRLQFSADMDPVTFDGHVRIAYSAEDSRDRGEPEPPVIAFTLAYVGADRALVIRPAEPWRRFREVHLHLLDGIRSTTGAPLRPFDLVFTTGGG